MKSCPIIKTATQADVEMDESFSNRIDGFKAKRMTEGEKRHGPLNLETDPRDFIQEGIEELVDFLNYMEMAMLRGNLRFC